MACLQRMVIMIDGMNGLSVIPMGVDPEAPSKRKIGAPGGPIRILVLTSNPLKKEEFKKSLGEAYGVDLTFRDPPELGGGSRY